MFSLFCKTWINDWQWLKVAMTSVQKNCLEPVQWVIVLDDGTKDAFLPVITQVSQASQTTPLVNLFETKEHWNDSNAIGNGYLRQQWIKMNSNRIMGDGFYLNWDSDVIAQKPFSSANFMGCCQKPIHWFTQFNSLMNGHDDAAHHQRMQMIRDIFGLPEVSFEWMRCMPMPVIGGILKEGAKRREWAVSYDLMLKNDMRVSEFNIIGQFAHLFCPDSFDYRNTHNYERTWAGAWGDKNAIVSQGWSWSGCPKNVHDEVMGL